MWIQTGALSICVLRHAKYGVNSVYEASTKDHSSIRLVNGILSVYHSVEQTPRYFIPRYTA